jgi:hypothetical protein
MSSRPASSTFFWSAKAVDFFLVSLYSIIIDLERGEYLD